MSSGHVGDERVLRLEAAIADHVRSFFPGRQINELPADDHVSERLARLHILEIEPAEASGLWTYVSLGAWVVETAAGSRMEYVLLAPEQSARAAELVTMIAYYHANP